MKELDIEARTENLHDVLAFVDEELDKENCPPKVKVQIDIAVEEIFVNIAHYAYNPTIGTAKIRIGIEDGQVTLSFVDQGIPYDPLAREDPDITLSAEEREIGGLGIFMVKKSMDDVQYEYKDGRNILTFRKTLDIPQ